MMRYFFAVIAALLAQIAVGAHAATAAAVDWVQLGPGGAAEARAVLDGDSCPEITIDGIGYRMAERTAAGANFPRLCATTLPATARNAAILGAVVPLPKPMPNRIIVLGDTGCRILRNTVQACNDPAKWPFGRIAAEAAKLNPDLVIDVGDYLYRESPCPAGNRECAGSPWGDNWVTWNADFFAPAAPLLAAAPWVFVRGNHEECDRSGLGWLRLLGPLPFAEGAACVEHIAPYVVPLPPISLVVIDDANAPETSAPANLIQLYRGDLAAVSALGSGPLWLAMHRPISGYVKVPPGLSAGGNQTLLNAIHADGFPRSVDLLLSGHIHAFEAINYKSDLPPQLIAGHGGDNLDAAPSDLTTPNIGGLPVASGLSLPGFGFLLLTRMDAGWNIDVFDGSGVRERTCVFASRHLDCPVH